MRGSAHRSEPVSYTHLDVYKRQVYNELKKDEMKRQFTIGIVDDVTNLSLPEDKNCPNTAAPGTIECKRCV